VSPDKPGVGLRERKKARTRSAIQEHALRLFLEQGYEATTVEQIAEAAEVSPSTFFRYFPSKQDVVLWDEFDPMYMEAFRSQPAELSPIQALRAAFRVVLSGLSPEEWEVQRARTTLVLSVPELRSAALDQFVEMVPVIADLVAERTGRDPQEPMVSSFAGAVIGVAFAAMLSAAGDPEADWVAVVDAAFGHLEAGLPL
jgi:AcrR family transcriptional regulator